MGAIEQDLRLSWETGNGRLVEEFHEALEELIVTEDEYVGLIHLEMLFRQRSGKPVSPEEYADRFPHLAHRLGALIPDSADFAARQSTQVFKGLGATPSSRSALPPDVRIPGYEVLEILGRGGMGVVYKARQYGLNRLVALKMVLAGKFAAEDELERFWREAEAVASLSHPNIVQVYEVNRYEGNPYFSLEYIEGGTLAEHLRKGPLSSRDAARLVEQLAGAMQFAHDRQIIHRDLKPANILLGKNPEGDLRNSEPNTPPEIRSKKTAGGGPDARLPHSAFVPKITDFGVAKRLDETQGLTATGIAAGTPQYMSPEQALADANHPLSASSDIYSLGVILYECLTGHVPIDGDNSADVMRRVVREPPPPPSRHRTGLSRDLETICLKCLEKQPRQRYLTAADLAADLRRWQEGRPIEARPVGRVEHSYRWCRRNPAVAGLLAGIMLALLAGTAAATAFAIRASRYADQANRNAFMLGDEKILAEQNAKEAKEQERIALANEEMAKASEQKAKASEKRALESEAKATAAFGRAEAQRTETLKAKQAQEEANIKLRAQMHALRSNMAFADLKAGQLMTARSRLDQMMPQLPGEPDLRGFEWWYLSQLSDPAIKRQHFRGEVTHLSPTGEPDSWYLGLGGNLYVTDLKSDGNPYRPLPGGDFEKLAVHRDSNRVAYVPRREEFVFVCDHTTLEVLHKIPLPNRLTKDKQQQVNALRFSPDGKRLLVAVGSWNHVNNPGYVVVWDMVNGKELRRQDAERFGVADAVFSGDGRRLVFSNTAGEWRMWDANTLEKIAGDKAPGGAVSLLVDYNASLLVIGGLEGKSVVVDTATGRALRTLFGHSGYVSSMTLSPDGQTLATSADDQSIRLWNIGSGENVRTFPGHGAKTTALSFSPTGAKLASGSDLGEVNIWDCLRDSEALVYRHEPNILREVYPLPDRRWLAADYWGRFLFLNHEGEPDSPVYHMTGERTMTFNWAMSPDGRQLASFSENPGSKQGVWVISLDDRSKPGRHLSKVPVDVHHMAFSPDGHTLATIHKDGRLRLTDLATEKETQAFQAGGDGRNFVAFTPDGKELITASGAGMEITRWSLKGKPVWKFADQNEFEPGNEIQKEFFTSLAVSPDGKLVAVATANRDIRILDASTGLPRLANLSGTLPETPMKLKGHLGKIQRVVFDSSGTRLASTSDDQTVRVWDALHGYALLNLRGHTGPVFGVSFSADGSGLASAANLEVRIWDGRKPFFREEVKNISRQCRLQDVRPVVGVDGSVRVSALFVNESRQKLKAPDWSKIDDRIRAVILLEPPDPKAVLPRTLAESNRARITHTPYILFDEILPGEAIPVSMSFSVKDWPPGKYRLWFTHSNGSLYSGRESPPVEFVLSAEKKPKETRIKGDD
ncbi:protein kinase domain-containing protein [Zavarzinella formosa]|uniref:protein kinase domain-containing protein n=1 Tax=Zavarzinella formosa TaxID=360055 RepID=UPI0002DB25F0|nr:protein kinase [Zavarzinella formosa]